MHRFFMYSIFTVSVWSISPIGSAMDLNIQREPSSIEMAKPLPTQISNLDKGAQLEIKEDLFLKKQDMAYLAVKSLVKPEKTDVSCQVQKASDSDRVLVKDLASWKLDFSETSLLKAGAPTSRVQSQVQLQFVKKDVDGYLTLSCERSCLPQSDCSITSKEVSQVLEANGLKINNIKVITSTVKKSEETTPTEEVEKLESHDSDGDEELVALSRDRQ